MRPLFVNQYVKDVYKRQSNTEQKNEGTQKVSRFPKLYSVLKENIK